MAARRAVIRYPIGARRRAPRFFEATGGDWALDRTMMQRAIRFRRDNSRHFDPAAEHAYAYTFRDWRLDARGYSQTAR